MTSDKKSVALLTEIFAKKKLKDIVISPGSRNAPIILSFAQHHEIEAVSIVDERSAAFFALGMAKRSRQTVAIACTSGTAALNYAPAIAEAYYQKVPLLVLTSDRPAELIDQGDGQTIRQKNIYANYIKKSYELPEHIESDEDIIIAAQTINEAINLTKYPDAGPVHINLPFTEPLYNQVDSSSFNVKCSDPVVETESLDETKLNKFVQQWNNASKKLIIAGMMYQDTKLQGILKKIASDPSVVVLSETTSNLKNDFSYLCTDKVVHTITSKEYEQFRPDLLVSFGGQVVSKMVKVFIKKNKPRVHWHIDPVDVRMDTYQSLTCGIPLEPQFFFGQLSPMIKKNESSYKKVWSERDQRSEARHQQFLQKCEYTDLKVFEILLQSIPEHNEIHLGNSTPVRYAQLFKSAKKFTCFSNRGTSGIDGGLSTSAGAACKSVRPTTIITGDLGFFYDSNALMNKNLSGNLRIIIINNSGGGIFRFIPGPAETDHLEQFFETKHNWNARYIAKNFDIPYYSATDLKGLDATLPDFFSPRNGNKPAILEIFTPNEKNAETLKAYFKYLKD